MTTRLCHIVASYCSPVVLSVVEPELKRMQPAMRSDAFWSTITWLPGFRSCKCRLNQQAFSLLHVVCRLSLPDAMLRSVPAAKLRFEALLLLRKLLKAKKVQQSFLENLRPAALSNGQASWMRALTAQGEPTALHCMQVLPRLLPRVISAARVQNRAPRQNASLLLLIFYSELCAK